MVVMGPRIKYAFSSQEEVVDRNSSLTCIEQASYVCPSFFNIKLLCNFLGSI